jgi:hypothetical protein
VLGFCLSLQRHTGSAAAFVAAAAALYSTSAAAQVVEPLATPQPAPWSWQHPFDPVPFAKRWEEAASLMELVEPIPPEDTPVRSRVQPGYEAVGIRSGSWMFYPSLAVGGVFNSNVFASNVNKQSDFAVRVQPTLNLQTLWGRHEINVQADATSDSYLKDPGLDEVNANLRARARIDLTHDRMIVTSARAAHLNDPVGSLSSPQGAVQPTPYDLETGDATYVQQFGRLAAAAGIRLASYDFGTTRAQDGSIINEDSRDGQVYAGHTRFEYVFSPKFGLFGALDVNRRNLRGNPMQSFASSGYRTLAGVTFELTPLVTGEVAAGYSSQRFDAATIPNITGPTYRALLKWSPTRMLDVYLKAEHAATDVSETSVTGVDADALQLGFDYEIRRNVIFSAAGIYEQDRFIGQPRQDTVLSSLAEIKYMLNRHFSISLRHRFTDRKSNEPTFTYDRHLIILNATARY